MSIRSEHHNRHFHLTRAGAGLLSAVKVVTLAFHLHNAVPTAKVHGAIMVVTKPAEMDGTVLDADILTAIPLVAFSSKIHLAVAAAPLLCAVVVVAKLGHRHLAVDGAPLHRAVIVVSSSKRLGTTGHRLGSVTSSFLLPLLLSGFPLLHAPPVLLLLLPLSCLLFSLQLAFRLALLGGILRVAKWHEEPAVPAEGKPVFWLRFPHLAPHPQPSSNQPSMIQPVVSWALGSRPSSLSWSLRSRPMPNSTTASTLLQILPESSAIERLCTLIETPIP